MALAPGDQVPDFSLQDQHDKTFHLYDALAHHDVVIYFYPKDDTPGCTREACSFRDSYETFKDAGAEVIGISSDSVESHEQFAKKHNLPFTLLSDAKGEVRKLFGVPKTLFVIPGRTTYVIKKGGKLVHRFNSLNNPDAHIEESLKALEEGVED